MLGLPSDAPHESFNREGGGWHSKGAELAFGKVQDIIPLRRLQACMLIPQLRPLGFKSMEQFFNAPDLFLLREDKPWMESVATVNPNFVRFMVNDLNNTTFKDERGISTEVNRVFKHHGALLHVNVSHNTRDSINQRVNLGGDIPFDSTINGMDI
jgi:hypothetical protein